MKREIFERAICMDDSATYGELKRGKAYLLIDQADSVDPPLVRTTRSSHLWSKDRFNVLPPVIANWTVSLEGEIEDAMSRYDGEPFGQLSKSAPELADRIEAMIHLVFFLCRPWSFLVDPEIAEFRRWARQCEADEYTDSDQCWDWAHRFAARCEELLG